MLNHIILKNFLDKIPDIEKKFKTNKSSLEDTEAVCNENIAPVRNSVVLNIKTNGQKTQVLQVVFK